MSKRSAVLLLCAALLAAGGCAHRESGSGKGQEYLIYYSALSNRESESAVAGEHRALSAGQETVPALMSLLLSQPESAGLTSPFPSGLRLLDWQLEEGRLHLDLSDHYYSLSGVDLTLADACLALTFCQLEEVDSVYVTVEGHELPYRAAQQLSMENILLAGGADEPMSLGVDLWYLKPGGRALGVERRQIVKTVDQTLVQAVLAAWADGPEGELISCLPQGSQIRSVEVQDGVCVVDLSQEYIDGLPRSEQTAALTVYAMVNTLCELDGVEAVQLYIDGEPAPAVGDLPLDRALIPDTSLTEAGS
ncbi:GerMN domain-containing protein [uncultured Flavonifractor sp.]|uniref:GerMN domain-containing protein n=1 Tax=uncultured Flavonifractor sp. TaxID=1193534 RepID=UPI0026162E1F|nr:GerMN domain-containing protein [uncultured Flavonifractor sp.]